MVGFVVPLLADNPPAYSIVLVSLHRWSGGRTCRRQSKRASAACVRRSRGGSPRSSFRRVRETGGTRKLYERERSRGDCRLVVWPGLERRARCEGRWTATRLCQRRKRSVADGVRKDWSLSRRDAWPVQILEMSMIQWWWKKRVGSNMTQVEWNCRCCLFINSTQHPSLACI